MASVSKQVVSTPAYSGTTAGETASINRRPIRYEAGLLFGKYEVLKKFELLPDGQPMRSNRVYETIR